MTRAGRQEIHTAGLRKGSKTTLIKKSKNSVSHTTFLNFQMDKFYFLLVLVIYYNSADTLLNIWAEHKY